MSPICIRIKDDGDQCRAPSQTSSKYCYTHDPSKTEERTEARRRGAAATNARRKPTIRTVEAADLPGELESLQDVARWLTWTAISLAIGRIDARTGAEVTKSLKELRPTLQQLVTDAEFRKLKAEVARLKKDRR